MIQLKAHDPVACSHHGEVNGVCEQETTGIGRGVVSAAKEAKEEEYTQNRKAEGASPNNIPKSTMEHMDAKVDRLSWMP